MMAEDTWKHQNPSRYIAIENLPSDLGEREVSYSSTIIRIFFAALIAYNLSVCPYRFISRFLSTPFLSIVCFIFNQNTASILILSLGYQFPNTFQCAI